MGMSLMFGEVVPAHWFSFRVRYVLVPHLFSWVGAACCFSSIRSSHRKETEWQVSVCITYFSNASAHYPQPVSSHPPTCGHSNLTLTFCVRVVERLCGSWIPDRPPIACSWSVIHCWRHGAHPLPIPAIFRLSAEHNETGGLPPQFGFRLYLDRKKKRLKNQSCCADRWIMAILPESGIAIVGFRLHVPFIYL